MTNNTTALSNNNVPATLSRLREAAACAKWKGRGWKTDRDVYLVALDFADSREDLTVLLSVREVAMRAGRTWPCVHKSLYRLMEAGWIKRTDRERAILDAAEYRLNPFPPYVSRVNTFDTKALAEIAPSELGVWIGKYGTDVLLSLSGERQSARAVAKKAGCSPPTAVKWLKNLSRLGLAFEENGKWVLSGDWRDIETGTVIAKERRMEYERQRAAFAARYESSKC